MGYVEGRNVAIAFQWAGGHYELLPTLAEELVRQQDLCWFLAALRKRHVRGDD